MNRLNIGIPATAVALSALLALHGGPACAAENAPMTPEYAAKKENHRKQSEQRITDEKRRAAAEALKAERLKVHRAKQQVKNAKPDTKDN